MKVFVIVLALVLSVEGENRIAGGEAVFINRYPFSTALLTNRGEGTTYEQACGGTILTASAILSAASCFYTNGTADEASWWRARVGTALANQGSVVHLLRRIDAHPDFSPTTLNNDIAVLRTTINLDMQTGTIGVARIAGGAFSLSINQPIWAIGWGLTSNGGEPSEELREVQFWVVNHETCTNRYAEIGFTVTDTMVCTGWLDVGVRGQCQGDSGSPIIDEGVVVGVHSWAEGCAQGWFPGINTLVAPYSRWIVATALTA